VLVPHQEPRTNKKDEARSGEDKANGGDDEGRGGIVKGDKKGQGTQEAGGIAS
jgi:hypothetical protein